ncbi:oligosaccharide flippase family protein [Pradoshia sp. D12]|uniref:oligosaccharide flippase family protein n=1 Tax=Bacillaceae TaxID=186817 RepID=UPI0011264404|nr:MULTISPECIES: oligosaccharide flippase family protein [Bacillaceae]QFK72921.1 oligosaccharide flippase family protein [Pradoshia sp. D12]TPF71913.1 flippase [Bacillus sp. D12]
MNQLKAGAMLSYLSIFITISIALLYTPVMIRLLGQSEYGLYALIGSVVGYLSILDMGLGNAIVRYTARNRTIGNKGEESKLNGMFMIIYSFIGILTIIIGLMLYYNMDNMFELSLNKNELEKAKTMVLLLTFNFAISFPLGIFGSIMQAYERFVVTKIVSIIRSLLIPLSTLPFLLVGFGSVAMVAISTLVNILCLIYNVYYCFKYLNINFYFAKFDYTLMKEIIGYSFFIFIGVIVDKIYWSTDQFILGIVSGTAPVAIYAIAMQFINLYMMFSTSISGIFLPRISVMVDNNIGNLELTKIMIKFGRLQFIIMAYILSGFVLFGQAFINFWAGSDYKEAFYITMIIMIPLIIPLIQNIGISILQAKNLHGFRSMILIFIAIFKIVISIPLSIKFGGLGTAVATAFSLFIGNIILLNIYYQQKVGLNMLLFWKNIGYLSVPISLSTIIGFWINGVMLNDGIIILILKIIIYSIIYLCMMWVIGFNQFEKQTFLSIYRKVINILVGIFHRLHLKKAN